MFEVVYDLNSKHIYLKTKDAPQQKWIDLSKLDYNCTNEQISLELNDNRAGLINGHLEKYEISQNQQLVNTAYNSLVEDGSLKGIYRIFVKLLYVNRLGKYPRKLKCKST